MTAPVALPTPRVGEEVAWVADHLGHVLADPDGVVHRSPSFRGGQRAADAALAAFDVAGYAGSRNEVWPETRRGASRLSPYIRHGLLTLGEVWEHVATGPARDRDRYRDELLWQEYARHLYARLGPAMARPLVRTPMPARSQLPEISSSCEQPWDRSMACMDAALTELTRDGWVVNQARMWLASQWTVRCGRDWREGEQAFFTHLLDGSRAANRLGWQWTVGSATGRPYGFSRSQVMRRAPDLCAACALQEACPVQDWPDTSEAPSPAERSPLLRRDADPDRTAGPLAATITGDAERVWLTAESLGDSDPALRAHPDLPVVFVWDEPLLARLRLSSTRLVFLAETLAELASRRRLTQYLGDPRQVLEGRRVAATFAPVPGFRSRAAVVQPVALYPYPWLVRPTSGPVTSFSAWRRHLAA
jgi:deoxyribodipyrimidine photo-lyase